MACYPLPCCGALRSSVMCCAVLYYAQHQWCTALCLAVVCCPLPCCGVLSCAMLWYAILCYAEVQTLEAGSATKSSCWTDMVNNLFWMLYVPLARSLVCWTTTSRLTEPHITHQANHISHTLSLCTPMPAPTPALCCNLPLLQPASAAPASAWPRTLLPVPALPSSPLLLLPLRITGHLNSSSRTHFSQLVLVRRLRLSSSILSSS